MPGIAVPLESISMSSDWRDDVDYEHKGILTGDCSNQKTLVYNSSVYEDEDSSQNSSKQSGLVISTVSFLSNLFDDNKKSGSKPPQLKSVGSGSLLQTVLKYCLAHKGSVMAWTSMALAVMSGSAIGPTFKYMEESGVKSLVAASWRNQSMLAFLTPLALLEYHWMSPEARCTHDLTARRPDLDYPVGVYVVIAGLGWSTSLLTWATALQYTSTVRASILTSLHTLYLVLYIHFTGGAVSMHEWCGVLVVMMGILIIGSDGLLGPPDPQYANISTANMLFGDILCLISALAQAVVIMNRKKTRKYIALMQYTVCTTSIVVTFGSLAAMVLEGATLFDLGNNSLLGWMSPNWLPMMLVFGLFVGVFCICGFNYAAAHIAPLVFSALTLLDPAFTGIISWLAGLESVPDLTVWLGGTTVIAGVGLLTYAEHARESAKGKSDQHSTQEAASENGAPDGAIAPVPRARALSVEHMGRDRSGSSASRAGRGTQLASFIKEQVVNPISALLTNGVAYSSVSGDAGSRGVADAEHDAQDDADVELSDMKGLYGGSIPGYSMLSQSGDSHGDYSDGDGIDRHSRDIEQGEQADCGVGGSSEQDENEMHHELDHGDGSFSSAAQPPQQTNDIEEYGIRRRSASTATSSGAVAGIDTAQYQPIAAITPPPPNGSFSDSPLRGARRSRSGTTTSGADGV